MSAKPTSAPAAPCERVNVLLDIDETLVYYISGKVRAHSWDKLTPAEQAKYNFSTRSPTDGVLILRPHVREFLSYLFRYFSVSLWTLSEREYAEDIAGVLLKLFKKRTPNQRFPYLQLRRRRGPQVREVASRQQQGPELALVQVREGLPVLRRVQHDPD